MVTKKTAKPQFKLDDAIQFVVIGMDYVEEETIGQVVSTLDDVQELVTKWANDEEAEYFDLYDSSVYAIDVEGKLHACRLQEKNVVTKISITL